MTGRAASTPSPHRSTNSINASLANAERRPPFAHDAGQAHADGHQVRSLTLAKRPMPGNHRVAATPDRHSFPSHRASQVVLRYSRRRVEALDFTIPNATIHKLNERVRVADLEPLSAIYRGMLERRLG